MKYSFVIPLYNAERYIAQCIDSLIDQSYEDIEVIVVDDSSTDASLQICLNLAKRDSRIKVVTQPNSGPGVARNKGVEVATGDKIIFVDADDFWVDKLALERLNKILIDHPHCDVLNFNCSYFYENDGHYKPFVRYAKEIAICKSGNACIFELVKSGTFPMSPCTKIMTRHMLLKNDIRFPAGTYSEDVPWFISLLRNSSKIIFINDYIYAYRKTGEQTRSTSFSLKKFTDLLQIVEKGISDTKKEDTAMLSFWAYELCILYGMCGFMNKEEKSKWQSYLSQFDYLLQYTLNPKVRKVFMCKTLMGMRLTRKLLEIYIKRTMA